MKTQRRMKPAFRTVAQREHLDPAQAGPGSHPLQLMADTSARVSHLKLLQRRAVRGLKPAGPSVGGVIQFRRQSAAVCARNIALYSNDLANRIEKNGHDLLTVAEAFTLHRPTGVPGHASGGGGSNQNRATTDGLAAFRTWYNGTYLPANPRAGTSKAGKGGKGGKGNRRRDRDDDGGGPSGVATK